MTLTRPQIAGAALALLLAGAGGYAIATFGQLPAQVAAFVITRRNHVITMCGFSRILLRRLSKRVHPPASLCQKAGQTVSQRGLP